MKISPVNAVCLSPMLQVTKTVRSDVQRATAPAPAPRDVQLAPFASSRHEPQYVRTTTVSATRNISGYVVRLELTAREVATADSDDRMIGRLCLVGTVILAMIGFYLHAFG